METVASINWSATGKRGTVYGVVHSFTGLFKKKIYLYTKASTAEQLLTAAYFAVIVRYL
jgi:hypothetical protein